MILEVFSTKVVEMPTLSDLKKHPKTFLKSYALWVSGMLNLKMQGKPDTKVWPVKLQRKPWTSCIDKSGVSMPCYELVEATSLDMELCYFLPFVLNQTREVTLGGKADLFFTDTMTGCSLGAMNGPTPKVAHLNYTIGGKEGTLIDSAKVGAEMVKVFGAAPDRSLKKADYKNAQGRDGNVTVVGVRRPDDNWDFVYQRRNDEGGGNYRLVSVHTVK